MKFETAIEMNEDGSFAIEVEGAQYSLIYDPYVQGGRWLVMLSVDGMEDEVLSSHQTLDSGLRALAIFLGTPNKFQVELPDGGSFSRPGKMKAEEVMAAHGYLLISNLRAYVIYSTPGVLTDTEAKIAVREIFYGITADVGDVDRIDTYENSWCCDITVPFEGYISKERMHDYMVRMFASFPVEVSSVIEYHGTMPDIPPEENIIHFPKAA